MEEFSLRINLHDFQRYKFTFHSYKYSNNSMTNLKRFNIAKFTQNQLNHFTVADVIAPSIAAKICLRNNKSSIFKETNRSATSRSLKRLLANCVGLSLQLRYTFDVAMYSKCFI